MIKQVKKNNKNFLLQGSILAIAGIIVRCIGLLYRSPMNSIIGATGNGYYSSAYNIYSFFLIVSSYSFPAAISKLISQNLANDRYLDIKRIIRFSFVFSILLGFISFSLMYFGAREISVILQKDKLRFALISLSPALIIMSFLSVFRGIFQGMGNMVPTALSQIIEQIANAFFSIIFAYILFNKGNIANVIYQDSNYEYAFGAAGGTIGTVVGAFFALLFLLFMYIVFFRNYKRFFNSNNGYKPYSSQTIILQLVSTIIPIIFSTTLYNISSIIDDIIFSNGYTIQGFHDEIVTLQGLYGQYHLLFNIPVAIASAFSASIIPSISTSVAEKNVRDVVLKIKYSFKFILLIVFPAFVCFFTLSEPICKFLFNGDNVDILIKILKYGSISIISFSLSTISISILHGLGYFYKPLINSAIALIFHIFTLIILLLVFHFGIYSLVYSNIIFSFFVFLLNQKFINIVVRYKKNIFRNYAMPLFCSLVMGVSAKFIYSFLNIGFLQINNIFSLGFKLLVSLSIALIVYLFLLITFGIISKRDVEYIPFIRIFYGFLRG